VAWPGNTFPRSLEKYYLAATVWHPTGLITPCGELLNLQNGLASDRCPQDRIDFDPFVVKANVEHD